jgi:hypothetical protein
MTAIKISDLNPASSSFFADGKSFMTELSEDELAIHGGISPTIISVIRVVVAITVIGTPSKVR